MNIYQLSEHRKNLIFSSNHNNQVIYENKKLLTDMKCKIDKCDNKKWEDAKKRANAYEYIYTWYGSIDFVEMLLCSNDV